MKKFIFGKLIDEENICNLEKEKKQILKNINNGLNTVIFGPRNFGKTSLIKNVIIKRFQEQNKKSFVFFVDLFNVVDEKTLNLRLKTALEHALAVSTFNKWLNEIKDLINSIRPEFSIDPVTGTANVSLKAIDQNDEKSIYEIFEIIKKISLKRKVLIVFDEFQDIVKLKSVQGILRSILQEMDVPVIVMGSKNHLLREIFSQPKEPFYQWGVNIEFKAIDFTVYHEYILERFKQRKISMDFSVAKKLQENMHRVPEAINIVCAEIMDSYENIDITLDMVSKVILDLIEAKQSQFEELLNYLSYNEQIIMSSIAWRRMVEKYNSIEYLSELKMNNKTVANIFGKLLDAGQIELVDKKYRVNDPLLEVYLNLYR